MSEVVVHVEGLAKQYRIGGKQERYRTLRDTLSNAARSPVRAFGSLARGGSRRRTPQETIYALRDVSFEVKRGETLGIIGRNGAGKTTLLKILSQITEPTAGFAEIRGRVGSLLEVGTGFHPELTGRENIYLNGAILGMKRDEIGRKFDEIVAFSEVEQFIDTPVKHYSSGMYLRLAFAVAAHLEPEVLVVDEVLAVGDAAFQRKCLGKMGDVAREGRTVLFVSHNISAIQRLCPRSLLIEKGRLMLDDATDTVIAGYERLTGGVTTQADGHVLYRSAAQGEVGAFAVTVLEIMNLDRKPLSKVSTWDSFVVRLWYAAPSGVQVGAVNLFFSTSYGQILAQLATQPDSRCELSLKEGTGYVDCEIYDFPFAAGNYVVGAGLAIPRKEWLFRQEQLATLTVHPRDVWQSGFPPRAPRTLVTLKHSWHPGI